MMIEESANSLFVPLVDGAKLPTKARAKDAGFDLYSIEDVELPGLLGLQIATFYEIQESIYNDSYISQECQDIINTRMKKCTHRFKTGIRWNGPPGRVGLLWDKSSIGDRCIKVFGGVIDEGYSGEILVRMMNLGIETWNVRAGDKICQILVQPVDDCGITGNGTRGADGFGSTDADGIFG